MPTLSYSGVDLHYERTGQGPPVLLLAGIASDSASWKPIIPALNEFATVYTMDNRCAGQTQPIDIETSRELIAQDVLALLDACQIDKVTLIGHSMGALISWAVASSAPDRINAVVAASAPFSVDPTRIELFNTLAKLRTDDNEAQSAFLQQCQALPSYLKPLDLPTTLPFAAMALTGENDKLFTPADMQRSYAAHPEVNLTVIEDAAHSVHWENPVAFVNAVNSFLSQLSSHT